MSINLLSILILFCWTLPATSHAQQKSETKPQPISVKGRTVGYSMRSRFRSYVYERPHDAFLLFIDDGPKELLKGRYIKLQYVATEEHREELPVAFFDQSVERSFRIRRDQRCDEQVIDFLDGARYKIKSEDAKRFPNLQRLIPVEQIPDPPEGLLPCYSFDWQSIQPN